MKITIAIFSLIVLSMLSTGSANPKCRDDLEFRFRDKPKKGCEWVALDPELRCSKKDKGNELSFYCPKTCKNCKKKKPTPPPSPSPTEKKKCRDDLQFRFRGKPKKDCEWVVLNPELRCSKKDNGNELSFYCPRACNKCKNNKNKNARPLEIPFTPQQVPTLSPTKPPTLFPTPSPTVSPSRIPSDAPSKPPSLSPTPSPTVSPSRSPSDAPSKPPSLSPTVSPTVAPSETFPPTNSLSTSTPTVSPSWVPTDAPSDTWPPTRDFKFENQPEVPETLEPTTTWPPTKYFPRDENSLIGIRE